MKTLKELQAAYTGFQKLKLTDRILVVFLVFTLSYMCFVVLSVRYFY